MKEKNTLSVSCCETELRLPGLGGGVESAWTVTAWVVRRSCDCREREAELRLPGL